MMNEITGNSIYCLKQFIRDKLGEEKLDEIISKTDKDVQEVLTKAVLSDRYYPIKVKEQFLDSLWKIAGLDNLIASSEYEAKKQLSGFFGFVSKFLSIDILVKRVDHIWRKVYKFGKARVSKLGDGHYKITVTEMYVTKAHRIHLEYTFKMIFEMVDKKEYKTSSVKIDDEHYEFDIKRVG